MIIIHYNYTLFSVKWKVYIVKFYRINRVTGRHWVNLVAFDIDASLCYDGIIEMEAKAAMKKWEWSERIVHFSGRRGKLELAARPLRENEVDLVMALQDRVYENMPDSSLLAPEHRWEVEESVTMDVCIGIFDEKRLCAFALMVINRDCEGRNKGQSYGLPPEDCVTFDTAFVDPDYRGMGMQAYLLRARNEIAAQLGAKYAFVTVSPDNRHSLNNLQKDGFEVLERKRMYSGYDRYVMKKML